LISYEKKGLITPVRTPGGIRRYRVEDIEQILGIIKKENNKKFLSAFGVELIIINGSNEEKEKTIELAEDLVAIVTSFAAKIYGKRGSKNDNTPMPT
jgi:predicted site-specific integrase-resolvase